jgi:hypothetical protein
MQNGATQSYVEYKRREFCARQKCGTACLYTTLPFHHWLNEKGYLILKPKKNKKVEKSTVVFRQNLGLGCRHRNIKAVTELLVRRVVGVVRC